MSAILFVILLIGSLGSPRASSCQRGDGAADAATAVASVERVLTTAHQHADAPPDAANATPAVNCGAASALPAGGARSAAAPERLAAPHGWLLVLPGLHDLPPPLRPPRLS